APSLPRPPPPRSRAARSRAPRSQHRRRHRRAREARSRRVSQRELLQEAQVVLVEQPDVLDAPFEERDALDAHAEGEAGVALRVVADGFEQRRMDHAAAEDLDPAGPLTHGTSAFARAWS